jgi:LacI family transcriptional regulator
MPQPRRVALMLDLEWAYKRHADIFAGAQQFAFERGWETTVDEFVDDTLRESPAYDGVIARATRELWMQAARRDVPVVNVWASSRVADLLPGVFPDWAACGRIYAEHLLQRGIRRFAAATSQSSRAEDVVLAAFREPLSAAGCPCVAAKVPLQFSQTRALWRKTKQTLATWMDRWGLPIGVYVGPENIGRITAQMCRLRGWRVPEDVAIVTGVNQETICEHPRPSLTSIEVGYERVGYQAARLLEELMDEKEKRKGKHKAKGHVSKPREPLLIPPQGLVVRESTDFFAVENEAVAAALKFISENSRRPIGAGDVARAVSTHPRTLTNRFREHLGRTITKEILHVRMERAKRELALTNRSLADIARDVGFGLRKQMYEVFMRELGLSPKQYRQQRQIRDKF